MLKLMTDSGNNFTKFSVFDDKEMILHHCVETKKITRNRLVGMLKGMCIPDYALVSSVNDYEKSLITFLKSMGIRVLERKKIKEFPLEVNYKNPALLGFDRLAAACGANLVFNGGNILVIDAGTALTIDVVLSGTYIGGTISPGLRMRFMAMHSFTDKLPLVTPDNKLPVTGKSTKECINSGALHGMLFEIEGFISYYKKKFKDLKIIMTGGDIDFLQMQFKNTIFAEPNLVHIGLNEIFDYHFSHS